MDANTESEMTSQTLSPPELNTLRIEIDGDVAPSPSTGPTPSTR